MGTLGLKKFTVTKEWIIANSRRYYNYRKDPPRLSLSLSKKQAEILGEFPLSKDWISRCEGKQISVVKQAEFEKELSADDRETNAKIEAKAKKIVTEAGFPQFLIKCK